MPKYQYVCEKCSSIKNKKIECDSDSMTPGYHYRTGEYLFFIECKMKDRQTNPKCPNCKSNKNVNVSYTDLDLQCYVRGNGLVKDKAGAKRDMHRHKLKHEDPYSSMRVSGEVDYLSDKFRRGGMDMGARGNTNSIVQAKANRLKELIDEVKSIGEVEKKIIVHIFKEGTNGNVTTTDLSIYSDDINKYLTKINKKYVYYHDKKQIWLPLAEGNRIYETLIGI